MKALHVISAVIGGAIAGAAVGLLLAPEKGSDSRRKIAEFSGETRDKIVDFLKEKGICMKKSKMDELVDEIEDKLEDIKD